MDGRDNIQSLLVLRKLTRAIAGSLRSQLAGHLKALTPILRPEMVFGKLIQGGQKEWIVKSDQALKELRTLYEGLAPKAPFHLRTDLMPPFDLGGLSVEITPAEYTHVVESGPSSRKITVRRPLTWTVSYAGFTPPLFRQLLDSRTRPPNELQRFLLAYLTMHLVTKMQPGVVNIFSDLRFPVTTAKDPEFGDLPMTQITAAIETERPADAVIIESAELTGMDGFEEVVRVEDIQRLRDPLQGATARHCEAADSRLDLLLKFSAPRPALPTGDWKIGPCRPLGRRPRGHIQGHR